MSEKSREKEKARKAAEAAGRAERGEPYTHDELDALVKSDPLAVDDLRIHSSVPLLPGRWYSRMFFLKVPPGGFMGPQGGDITGCLYRRDDDLEKWFMPHRFRYYAGERVWDGKDRKSFYTTSFKGTEYDALEGMRKWLSVVASVSRGVVDELVIEGNNEKVYSLIADETTRPCWVHVAHTKQTPGQSVGEEIRTTEERARQQEANRAN